MRASRRSPKRSSMSAHRARCRPTICKSPSSACAGRRRRSTRWSSPEMTGRARIRRARCEELAQIRALNEAVLPHVSSLTRDPLQGPRAKENIFLAAFREEHLTGFLLAMTPAADYDSPNFLWFCERAQDYLYVDRIVVEPGLRGSGIGRRLYATAAGVAPRQPVRIRCALNLQPSHPESLN